MVLDQLELSLLWLGPHVNWAYSSAGLMVMVAKILAALLNIWYWAATSLVENFVKPLISSKFYRHIEIVQAATLKGCKLSGYTLAKDYSTALLITQTLFTVKTEYIIMFFPLHTILPGISAQYREQGSHMVLFSPWKQLHIWQCDLCQSFYQPQR